MIKTKQVESSWVDKIAYSAKERTLWVLTKDNKVYNFNKVAPCIFTRLVNSNSIGAELVNFIRIRMGVE